MEIQVEEGVRPVVHTPRRIPFHYQEPLREHIQDQLPQAVTRKLLRRKMAKDETLQKLREDIRTGKCRAALHRYKQIFEELTEVDGLMVRGE